MAHTKDWTGSQQHENQYTWSQYVFNVGVMVLIGMALLGWLIYSFWPDLASTTNVFLIRSDVGDLRTIPFQEEDAEGLTGAFGNHLIVNRLFNDDASFNKQIDEICASSNESDSSTTTTIVVVSAIGGLDDNSKPVLLLTDGTNKSVRDFLTKFLKQSKSKNRIVIFDCGHDYSQPQNYFTDAGDGSNVKDDLNHFVDKLGDLVESWEDSESSDESFSVITSTSVGEIPLYSYNQRRTLFGLALENALGKKGGFANVNEFHESLVDYCHDQGGEAAQTPLLFSPKKRHVRREEKIVRLIRVKPPVQDESDETEQGPMQHPETKTSLTKIFDLWDAASKADQAKYGMEENRRKMEILHPSEIWPSEWDRQLRPIVDLAGAMRIKGQMDSVNSRFEWNKSKRDFQSAVLAYNRLFESPLVDGDEVSAGINEENLAIAKSFRKYQAVKVRAKYCVAIFDSLSWIDDGDSLKDFGIQIEALNKTLIRLEETWFSKPVLQKDSEHYRNAMNELDDRDHEVENCLKRLCEELQQKHGFTREMAIIGFLTSPLLESGAAEDRPGEFSRYGLMGLLANTSVGGFSAPVKRIDNHASRLVLNKQLEKVYKMSPGVDETRKRQHDSVACYMEVEPSVLRSLAIEKRHVIYSVTTAIQVPIDPKIIELKELGQGVDRSEIDLLLKMTNTDKVKLICRFDPPNAPFRIVQNGDEDQRNVGESIELDYSEGTMLQIYSMEAWLETDPKKEYALLVEIAEKYGEKEIRLGANLRDGLRIPLALPNEDRIKLTIGLKGMKLESDTSLPGNGQASIQKGNRLALRPWPNRAMAIELKVANFLHRNRKLRATLYKCVAGKQDDFFPGSIDLATKTSTLESLSRGRLQAIASSKPFEVQESIDGKWSGSVPVQLALSSEISGKSVSFTRGLLCRIDVVTTDESGTDSIGDQHWNFWLPVFSDTKPYIEFTPEIDIPKNQLVLKYKITDRFFDQVKNPGGLPIKIACRVGGKQYPPQEIGDLPLVFNLDPGFFEEAVAAENRNEFLFLYIDVDGWPRRTAFGYQNRQFIDPNHDERFQSLYPNAEFVAPRLTFEMSGPSPFKTIADNPDSKGKIRHRWGTVQKETPFLFGTVQINCDIGGENFQFPDSKDFFELGFEGIVGRTTKYYYPRKVESSIVANDEGLLLLECSVSDYDRQKIINPEGSRKFGIDPERFEFGSKTHLLNTRDITRIYFDDSGPKRPEVKLKPGKILVGGVVQIVVSPIEDTVDGVGADYALASVSYIRTDRQGVEAKPVKLGALRSDGTLSFKAPALPGAYELSVIVKDRLGNVGRPGKKTFQIDAIARPEPVIHTLRVKVKVASQRLKKDQNPNLGIEPDKEVEINRLDSETWEFSNLQPGVNYTVSGQYKLPVSGFNVETEGQVSWTTPKSEAPTKIITLTLER